ncbi:MAG: hypothetical protein ABSG53_00175 [Thermoguttaceae bacterium]
MVEMSELRQAVADGVLTYEEASGLMERAGRHAGGRPEGSKNSGPDALDRAVMALYARRSMMTEEELEESERRVRLMLTKTWNWRSKRVRRLAMARGALVEELSLLMQYKWSEDRVGMSRTRRAKGVARKAGRGYGYPMDPEPIVEASLDEGEVLLWGFEVTQAVQEELGFEPVRRRKGGRRWLEPVSATREFVMRSKKTGKAGVVDGAGSGVNGHALPELMPNGRLSYAVDATVGEQHQAIFETDPVLGGLAYEPDGRRASRVPNKDGKAGEPMWFSVGGYRPAPAKYVLPHLRPYGDKDHRYWAHPVIAMEPIPRSEGECQAGPYMTRWRPTGTRKWWKPLGMLEEPTPMDADMVSMINLAAGLGLWKKAGCQLPVIQPVVEGFLPREPRKPKRLNVAYSWDKAGPASIVWAEDGEPMKGTLEWAKWKWRFTHCHLDHWADRQRKPDRAPGWNVLPILSPPYGYVRLL